MTRAVVKVLCLLLVMCLMLALAPVALMEEVVDLNIEDNGDALLVFDEESEELEREEDIEKTDTEEKSSEETDTVEFSNDVVVEAVDVEIDEIEIDLNDDLSKQEAQFEAYEPDLEVLQDEESQIENDDVSTDSLQAFEAFESSSDILNTWYEYATYRVDKPFIFKTEPYESAKSIGGLQITGGYLTVCQFVENKYHNMWARTVDNKYVYAGYKKKDGKWIQDGDQYIHFWENKSTWYWKNDNLSGKKIKKGEDFHFEGYITCGTTYPSQIGYIVASLQMETTSLGVTAYRDLSDISRSAKLDPTWTYDVACSLNDPTMEQRLKTGLRMQDLSAGKYRIKFLVHTMYDSCLNCDYPGTFSAVANHYTFYAPFEVVESYTIDNNTPSAPNYNDLKFQNVSYPNPYTINPTYGWNLTGGIVSSSSGLKTLKSELLYNNTQRSLLSVYGPISISGTSYNIKNINTGVKFSQITQPGSYIWKLTATDNAGHSATHEMYFTAKLAEYTTNTKDIMKPLIANIRISDVTSSGYTVKCNVSDNVGVTKVCFPTWTEQNGQDDLIWHVGTISGNTASYNVKASEHKNETGCVYITHIYVYDAAGNFASAGTSCNVPTLSKKNTSKSSTTGKDSNIQARMQTITVTKNTKSKVYVGTKYQIDLKGKSAKSFKSSKTKVATVNSSGVIIPKAKGKAKITIKLTNKKKYTLTLTVKDPTIPSRVTLNKSGTIGVKKGNTVTLKATLPAGTNSAIKWTSSNKKVATVNNGVVTFKKKGKVTITATAVRGKKKAKVKFKVSK